MGQPTLTFDHGMLLGGEVVDAASGATFPVINPATEEEIGSIPAGGASDVDAAVQAAWTAAPAWAKTPIERRSSLLHEFASVLEDNVEELAYLDALDAGLPIRAMRRDVTSAAAAVEYYASLGSHLHGASVPVDDRHSAYTIRKPYGVVGRITAFNHPLKFVAVALAAPLMAGNSVVVKPPEVASLSSLRLAELVKGLFPAGVVNIVTGEGAKAGAALAAHPDVPRIAFTGSASTGRRILEAGAASIKHVSLELGGKNPMVVFPDVDATAVAKAAAVAMNFSRSQGQSCGSMSRVFVHESIRQDFVSALVAEVSNLRVGDPLDEQFDMGPLAFRSHFERVLGYIDQGVSDGATLTRDGRNPPGCEKGFFLAPTVFTDVDQQMTIAREEIFGPVMSVIPWENEAEMLEQTGATQYGLAASVWTSDHATAHRIAHTVDAGFVWVNTAGRRPMGVPFGGFKQSGLGKEASPEELLSYTQEQSILFSH